MNIQVKITKIQKLIARLLFVIFLLESCYNNNIQVNPQADKETNRPPSYLTLHQIQTKSLDKVKKLDYIKQDLSGQQKIADRQTVIGIPTENMLKYEQIIQQADRRMVTPGRPVEDKLLGSNQVLHLSTGGYNSSYIPTPKLVKYVQNNEPAFDTNSQNITYPKSLVTSQVTTVGKKQDAIMTYKVPVTTFLTNQICVARGGYQVKFDKKAGGTLNATVEKEFSNGFTRQILPAMVELGFSYPNIRLKILGWQKQYIHVGKDHVYIGRKGLMGGMQGGKLKKEDPKAEIIEEEGKVSYIKEEKKLQHDASSLDLKVKLPK